MSDYVNELERRNEQLTSDLEKLAKELEEAKAEIEKLKSLGGLKDFNLPMIRQSFPTNPLNDLVGVQPMKKPRWKPKWKKK